MNEHENEPVPGLPEVLPVNERLLWQGAPAWQSLLRSRFHVRVVVLYFLLALAWQLYDTWQLQANGLDLLRAALWILVPGGLGIGLLTLLAWLTSRTSLYSITNRRIVMRVGIALPMTVNIPFQSIDNASFRQQRNGCGDLLLGLRKGERCSYLVAWPHVRSSLLSGSQPMLLAIPQVQAVAQTLAEALQTPLPVDHPATAQPAAFQRPVAVPASPVQSGIQALA